MILRQAMINVMKFPMNYRKPFKLALAVLDVDHSNNNRDLEQGRRRRLRELCLKILFPVTVIILLLLHAVWLGNCECSF